MNPAAVVVASSSPSPVAPFAAKAESSSIVWSASSLLALFPFLRFRGGAIPDFPFASVSPMNDAVRVLRFNGAKEESYVGEDGLVVLALWFGSKHSMDFKCMFVNASDVSFLDRGVNWVCPKL